MIEAAHFEPTTIFRTARRHKLPSRGVQALRARRRPAAAGVRRRPGRAAAGRARRRHRHRRRHVRRARPRSSRVDHRCPGPPGPGHRHADRRRHHGGAPAHRRLHGHATERRRRRRLTALPPTWRPDLTDPYDLVEEVARVVGYTQVPSVLPAAPPGRGLTACAAAAASGRLRAGRQRASSRCASWPFVGAADFDRLGLPDDDPLRDTIRVANPLSERAPLLTTTLLPGLLETAARNLGRGQGVGGGLRDRPGVLPDPGPGQGARSSASTGAPTTPTWRSCSRPSRGSR